MNKNHNFGNRKGQGELMNSFLLDGSFHKQYTSPTDITADGFDTKNVYSVISGKRRSHKGRIWLYAKDDIIDRTLEIQGHHIFTYNLDGTIAKEYKNIFDAVADGHNAPSVYNALTVYPETYKMLQWKFGDVPTNDYQTPTNDDVMSVQQADTSQGRPKTYPDLDKPLCEYQVDGRDKTPMKTVKGDMFIKIYGVEIVFLGVVDGKDFGRRYGIDATGDIYNTGYDVKVGFALAGTKLTTRLGDSGYVMCDLVDVNGRSYMMRPHRVVCNIFKENPANKPQVNHIDGNKQNNHFTNLEWSTASENVQHRYGELGHVPGRTGTARRITSYEKDGTLCKHYASINEVEADGYNRKTVYAVCKGSKKSYKGKVWKYNDALLL